MTTNAIQQPLEAQAVSARGISPVHGFYSAVRRELCENRSIYLAPLGVGALFLLGYVVSAVPLPQKMRAGMALGPMKHHEALMTPYDIAAGLMMITMMIVGTFYCLDALYGERRDRSILFWKSLPVSDTTTVLAKASIPFVALPFLAFAVGVLTQLVVLLLSGSGLGGSGQSVASLWTQLSFPRMAVLLFYHMLMMHVLWHAPFYAWFLLVGAWVRRSPFVWGFLVPIALCFLEKIVFNTTHFLDMIRYRLNGNGMDVLLTQAHFVIDPMTQMTPLRYLSSPGLWIGLAFTAVFIAAAVQLRRYGGPM